MRRREAHTTDFERMPLSVFLKKDSPFLSEILICPRHLYTAGTKHSLSECLFLSLCLSLQRASDPRLWFACITWRSSSNAHAAVLKRQRQGRRNAQRCNVDIHVL